MSVRRLTRANYRQILRIEFPHKGASNINRICRICHRHGAAIDYYFNILTARVIRQRPLYTLINRRENVLTPTLEVSVS